MKTLSEYSVEELRTRIGYRVRSLVTSYPGTLVSVSDNVDNEDYTADIEWDHGGSSRNVWLFWLTKIFFEEDLSGK